MAAKKSQPIRDAAWVSPNGKWIICRREPRIAPDMDNPYSTLAVVYLSDGWTGGEIYISVCGDITYEQNALYGPPQYARDKAESILKADWKAATKRPKAFPNRRGRTSGYRITAVYYDPKESNQCKRKVYDAIAEAPGKGTVWLKDYDMDSGSFAVEYPRQTNEDLLRHVTGHSLILGTAPRKAIQVPKAGAKKASKNSKPSQLAWDMAAFARDYDPYEFGDQYGDMETAAAMEEQGIRTKSGAKAAIAYLEDEVGEIDYDPDLEKKRESLVRMLKALCTTSDTSEAPKASQGARKAPKTADNKKPKTKKAKSFPPRGRDGRFIKAGGKAR